MNLRHLKFFVELARTQHMARAAENLGISQPSLSYAISSIEKQLGIPLFEKEGRNIRLTNYGKIYLTYVQKSLSELDRGSQYISQLLDVTSGQIRLGFTFPLGQELVPRLVSSFRTQMRSNKTKFSFAEGTTPELINQLLADKLDLIVGSDPHNQSMDSKLTGIHLIDQEIVGIVPHDNPLAQKDSVSLQELAQYPIITYSKASGLRNRIFSIFKRAGVKPHVLIEAEEEDTISGFVHYGFGVALIPRLPQLDSHFVKQLHVKDIQAHKIFLLTKADHFLTPVVSRFEDFCQKYCNEHFNNKHKEL